jgi:hypothetical protein
MRSLLLAFAVFVIITSGCISGQAIKRQAAEPATNVSQEYEDNAPQDCPGSVTQCADGYNDTCQNYYQNEACTRCMPVCEGHGKCVESWSCSNWSSCSSGTKMRLCVDRSGCNSSLLQETEKCQSDRTSSDCPSGKACTRYFCEGQPKECKPYMMIPCCGDGRCEEGESCASDCPPTNTETQNQQTGQAQQNTTQENSTDAQTRNETNQQNQTMNETSTQNVTVEITEVNTSCANITSINATSESVEVKNTCAQRLNMANWTLIDAINSSSHTFTFHNFILQPGMFVYVHTEGGSDNETDLYWGKDCPASAAKCIWNNDNDTAYLRDSSGLLVSEYSY